MWLLLFFSYTDSIDSQGMEEGHRRGVSTNTASYYRVSWAQQFRQWLLFLLPRVSESLWRKSAMWLPHLGRPNLG